MATGSLREVFADPDPEYGPVPLWWWDGEALDPDRLTAQLEALSAGGVPSVCFISKYPNGPAGDEQRYFSEAWWDRLEHVAGECDRLGMELWVHDETYHHSPPDWREYWGDALRAETTERPGLQGRVLHRVADDVEGGETAVLDLPDDFEPLSVAAYPRDGDGIDLDGAVELDPGDRVEWTAPDGAWHVAAVGHRPEGLCYTTPDAAERYIDLHYEAYVRRLGDLVGDVLAGTFEDELVILDGEVPCDGRVLERFRETKGYDPDLIALYEATDATTTLRTDYYDVVTTLLEECWFEPLHEWHEAHDMLRAHDNWGRNDLAAGAEQYGDYPRTMRWYSAPGYDDGGPAAIGNRNFFDAKLAASIAACYDRERVWGELFHSTGWGFAPDDQLAGVVENVCYGCTLYDKHGLYYTTLGGWWAHAPGDVHFRQPYWEQVGELNDAATRLCALFSRGHPVVDVALTVPTASLHADWHPEAGVGEAGNDVDAAVRGIAESLYESGTDLVLADPESLADAALGDGALGIADMSVPALVLPPTTAIERSTLAAARDLHDAGGIVAAVGRLPTAAVGEGDADLDSVLEELFDASPGDAIGGDRIVREDGGAAVLAGRDADLTALLGEVLDRDVRAPPDVYHAHRRIGEHDAYLLFNARDAERAAEVGLRADGRPERWDPLTGETEPIHAYERDGPYARLDLTFAPHGHHLIVFGPDEEAPRAVETSLGSVDAIEQDGERVTVRGTTRGADEPFARVVHGGEGYAGTGDPVDVPAPIAVEGWTFEPDPVLDNRWGDFRYPPSGEVVGPEVRAFRHRAESPGEDGREQGWHRADAPDGEWKPVEPTYGPYFWRCVGDPAATPDDSPDGWEPYAFSKQVGRPGTHPYFLGYASIVSDEFLVAGDGVTHFWTTVRAPADGAAAIQHGPGIRRIELGERTIEPGQGAGLGGVRGDSATLESGRSIVHLPAGETAALIAVEPGVETHFAVEPPGDDARERDVERVPRVRWFRGDDLYELDYTPWEESPVGWYRFDLPAGTARFSVPVRGDARVWVDGEERQVEDGAVSLDEPVESPTAAAVRVEPGRGAYGGAAWTGPVSIETVPVPVDPGPWEELGLESYSGHGRYRATVTLPDPSSEDRVVLDLGDVGVSATVRVNGDPAGAVFSRPFEVEITEAAREGENDLEVTVANTLANHFAAETPRRYVREGPLGGDADDLLPNAAREETVSGLLGPVTVRIERGVTVEAEPE